MYLGEYTDPATGKVLYGPPEAMPSSGLATRTAYLGDKVKRQIEEETRMKPETAAKVVAIAVGPGLLIGGILGGGKGAVIGALVNAAVFGAWTAVGIHQIQNEDPFVSWARSMGVR
jgi:hypothetical protein